MENSTILSNIPLLLSLWGAVLSTTLAFLKLRELWNQRFKIKTNHVFRSDPYEGNEIHIQNLSSKPVLLEYMVLFYKKGSWWKTEKKRIWSPEDSILNFKIEPFSAKSFNFTEFEHFSWKGKTIYAKLSFAGRKEIVKKINSFTLNDS